MTAAAPSGVVTFLFTDVEGSTRRWEADADGMRRRWPPMTRCCARRSRRTAGSCSSHTGDGFVAAFASPMSAVDAAIDAQRELQLPVRMGLATGEAELRDGDYFGTVLNRAARVMAAGHGGQILLAESTAGLLSGVDLIDLGPRRLRDLPTPVGVFQVRAPGLRTEFPVIAWSRLESRKFASGDHELDRPRRRGLQSSSGPALASVGDIGGRRWSGQDPAGVGSRDAVSRRICRRGLGFRVGCGQLIRRRYPMRWRRCWESLNNLARASASRWRRLWRAGRGCWCSTTVSTSLTASRIWSQRSSRRRPP